MSNIIGLKPSQPFTLCKPITVDFRIAATVLVTFSQQVHQENWKMARGLPVEFNMYFKVEVETVIRGHHV